MSTDTAPVEITIENAPAVAEARLPEVQKIVEDAKAFVVRDEASYTLAVQNTARCKEGIGRVEANFGEAREAAHTAWKAITTAIARLTGPLKEAAEHYSRKAYAWQAAERAKKQAEEAARQRAEQERLEKQKLAQAQFLEAAGASEEADRVLEETVEVVPQHVEAAPKIAGTALRENWDFEIVDAAAIPREYLTPDLGKIRSTVRGFKGETRIPGVRVFDKGSIVARKG